MQWLLAFGVWMLVSSYCFAETLGDFSYTTNEVGAKITGYSGTGTIVSIPSEISGIPVKIIGVQSFINNTNISKVILPNSIVKIEAQAFQGCSALDDINLPEGITHIGTFETGGATFVYCNSLTNIILPTTLTYLAGSMFEGTKIQKINIRSNLDFLGPWAFYNASYLKEVIFEGELPAEMGGSIFGGNAPNFVVKYVSGLSSWSNAAAIFPGIDLIPFDAVEGYDSNNDGISDKRALDSGLSISLNLGPLIESLKTNPITGLYTTNQIYNLGLGGIILNRGTNNELTLNYQILESTNLVNWTTNSLQMPITNAPTNKMFLRVQAVGQ